jgi:hypothetical protein
MNRVSVAAKGALAGAGGLWLAVRASSYAHREKAGNVYHDPSLLRVHSSASAHSPLSTALSLTGAKIDVNSTHQLYSKVSIISLSTVIKPEHSTICLQRAPIGLSSPAPLSDIPSKTSTWSTCGSANNTTSTATTTAVTTTTNPQTKIGPLSIKPLLQLFLPTTVACEGRLAAPAPGEGNAATVSSSAEEAKTETHEVVLLHNSNTDEEWIVQRVCHVVFAWSVFASLWVSVLAFPYAVISALLAGAWVPVAALAGVWAGSLVVSLPPSHELRRFLFRGLHKWFPHVDIVYEEEPARARSIFCVQPHGVLAVGTTMLVDDLTYRKLHDGSTRDVAIVMSPFLRWCNPLWKLLTDITGVQIHGAGRRDFRRLLASGRACALLPGGFHEATIACVGKERVYIKDRKGFVKYALRAGYSLTPVYVFGESDMYYNPQGGWDARFYLNEMALQLPAVLPFGYVLAPLAPRRVPIRIVCGPAIPLPKIEEPTQEDVNLYHDQYMNAVSELYYRHAERYNTDLYTKHIDPNAKPRALEQW